MPRPPSPAPIDPAARFESLSPYRARREWQRYEGTPRRDLYRVLRERFLVRHAAWGTRSLDVGSGPGRFTPLLGTGPTRVALDLSPEMLRFHSPVRGNDRPYERVRGNALRPPFPDRTFHVVALLGNSIGFAEASSGRLIERSLGLVAPGGAVVIEVAPGPGERSSYLARLPPTAAARLLRSPVPLVARRIRAQGFETEPRRRAQPGAFRRVDPASLRPELTRQGFDVAEVLAVAPASGPLEGVIDQAAADPKAWTHLLEVEEALGRDPDRHRSAASVLVAARARGGTIK